MTPEVTVIGAGIVGCAAAAFLAEAGVTVEVIERDGIASGASGRNSGVLQHPLDPVLEPLYLESLRHHADALGDLGPPAGTLVLGAPDSMCAEVERRFPALQPELLEDARAAERVLAPGVGALRLETGHPVAPAASTEAFAQRARAAGARFTTGEVSEVRGPAVVAAGPWTGALLPGIPVRPLWGVVADVVLAQPPRHALEEAGVEALLHPDGPPPALFSLVHAAGRSSLGSTFSADEPDPDSLVAGIRERGRRFVPALRDAPVRGTRACARPASADGRPTIGMVDAEGDPVVVAAGHGPWGLTLGPASGRLAAEILLGRAQPPPELSPQRWT